MKPPRSSRVLLVAAIDTVVFSAIRNDSRVRRGADHSGLGKLATRGAARKGPDPQTREPIAIAAAAPVTQGTQGAP